jgi:hypothetical protein
MSIRGGTVVNDSLVNAPLSHVLKHPAFWSLSTWAGVHILKLNFVVATINDQLNQNVDQDTADHLIDVLGAMLPFGFIALPLVAAFLDKAPMLAFQLANTVGVMYGAVLAFCPGSTWMQSIVVFPSVACSRQLVYSTLFHQVGAIFGFANYGVLLGLINVAVSTFSTVQTSLVKWAEQNGSYYWANLLLVSISIEESYSFPCTTSAAHLVHVRLLFPYCSFSQRPHYFSQSCSQTQTNQVAKKVVGERKEAKTVELQAKPAAF